jgi:hypothetical protein
MTVGIVITVGLHRLPRFDRDRYFHSNQELHKIRSNAVVRILIVLENLYEKLSILVGNPHSGKDSKFLSPCFLCPKPLAFDAWQLAHRCRDCSATLFPKNPIRVF